MPSKRATTVKTRRTRVLKIDSAIPGSPRATAAEERSIAKSSAHTSSTLTLRQGYWKIAKNGIETPPKGEEACLGEEIV
jgi:hypothetical protein